MQIYLISATRLESGMESFLQNRNLSWVHEDCASDAELVAEAAGRVCYMSFGLNQYRKSTGDYLHNILLQGHDSVLEHANFTLLVDGITRALSHQLVRHRAGFAYSQLSQQYHDETDSTFIEPSELEDNPELREQWTHWQATTRAMHESLRNTAKKSAISADLNSKEQQRHSRSTARLVLPNASSTTIVITGNARAWRHVLSIRGDIAGDIEMRNYCIAAYEILLKAAPNLFSGFEIKQDKLGRYVCVQG